MAENARIAPSASYDLYCVVKFDAVDGHPTIAKEVAVSSMEEQQQQLEAMILRNFLLVQADKHGHHLLASLPSIAGDTPTGHQFPAHLTGIKVRQVPLKGQ